MENSWISVHVKVDFQIKKYLVPKTMTTSNFSNELRKRLRFAQKTFKVGTYIVPEDDTTMDALYKLHTSSQDFLEIRAEKYIATINIQ